MAVAQEPIWTLGNRLWRAREEAGLDQDTMAKRLGVSRALVSKWERDKSEPTLRQVRQWSEETGVSFGWLADYPGEVQHRSGVVYSTRRLPALASL